MASAAKIPREQRTAAMCAAYRKRVPVKVIAEQFGINPAGVFKALRRGGALPQYQTREKGLVHRVGPPGGRIEKDRQAEALRVSRDVCWRCGARGDAGCGHT